MGVEAEWRGVSSATNGGGSTLYTMKVAKYVKWVKHYYSTIFKKCF